MNNKKTYLLRGTPSLLLPLGAGFVMASSSDTRAALGMGVAVIVTMLLSSILISAIRNIIPNRIKMPAYVLIITGFVTLIDMLMQAWVPEVVNMLGVHLACLAVSAVPFRDADEVADHNGELETIKISTLTGVFFTVIMLVCALIREFFGNASIWGNSIEFMNDYKISALAGAFGGYLVLALVLALIRKVGSLIVHRNDTVKEEQ